MSRYARRIDSTQRAVIDALRALGASVEAIQGTRAGVPDLVVGVRGVTTLVEVKPDKGGKAATQLRDTQEAWHRQWKGRPVEVVRTVDDAVALVNRLQAEAA